MYKINSADRALTEAELAAIVGGTRSYFNDVIAKGVAADYVKDIKAILDKADFGPLLHVPSF